MPRPRQNESLDPLDSLAWDLGPFGCVQAAMDGNGWLIMFVSRWSN